MRERRRNVPRAPFVVTVAVAAGFAACGGHAVDDTDNSGGAAGVGGSSAGVGGGSSGSGGGSTGGTATTGGSGGTSVGGAGGTGTAGASGGGAGGCPTGMPVSGTPCAIPGAICSYQVNGPCCPPTQAHCANGRWSIGIPSCNPPPPDPCPINPPVPGSPCRSQHPCGNPPVGECFYSYCPDGAPSTIARCDGSAWQVRSRGCSAFDAGPAHCFYEEQALAEFVKANKACMTTTDCVTRTAVCAQGAEYCDGSYYMNRNADLTKWRALADALYGCMTKLGGCGTCDGIPPVPVCAGGICRGL